MTEYGHGSHWSCFTDEEALLTKHLRGLVEDGIVEDTAVLYGDFFEDQGPLETTVYSLALPDHPLSGIALVAINELEETSEFVSGYPYIKGGTTLRLRIDEIHEWPNHYEAVISGATASGAEISFFDTKYFAKKNAYRRGEEYEFSIAASAYSAEIPERTFQFEGEQALDFLAKTGRTPDRDEDGSISPVVFDLSNLVAYLPRGGVFPDDAEFQSPVVKVDETYSFDNAFYRLKIHLSRDPDVLIDLYAKQHLFSEAPEETNPVRGVLWMQGHLLD